MLNPNLVSKKRNIDIVFCMDGTGSMRPCIESIKENAKSFYMNLVGYMTGAGSDIDLLRVKFIVFRDYKSDGDEAMVESSFFELPDDEDALSDYLGGIRAHGGCGQDANGLEALYLAMKSDFCTGPNDRQIIVMFADTTALNLGRRAKCEGYPADMVDRDGLSRAWMCIGQDSSLKLRERNKRLVIFAPQDTVYEEISRSFNRCVYTPVENSKGLQDITFDDIIKIIAASASGGFS